MRLWCFMSKYRIDSILRETVWYNKDNDVHPIDSKYIGEVNNIEVYPIKCYARIWESATDGCLSMRLLYNRYGIISREFNIGCDGILVELEIPEEFALSAKDKNKNYLRFLGKREFKETNKEIHYYNNRSCVLDKENEVITSNIQTYCRNYNNGNATIEVLIPCIKKEHIVAYRTFNKFKDSTIVETIVINDHLLPLWKNNIYINGDGYARYLEEDGELSVGGFNQADTSMRIFPEYFSVEEVFQNATIKIQKKLFKEFNGKDLDIKNIKYTDFCKLTGIMKE